MNDSVRIVFCTCPDEQVADRLAQALLEARLAACVTLLDGARSLYRWNDKVESATEVLAVIKTTPSAYPELEKLIAAMHPYDVPEIVALDTAAGLPAYMDWVKTCASVS